MPTSTPPSSPLPDSPSIRQSGGGVRLNGVWASPRAIAVVGTDGQEYVLPAVLMEALMAASDPTWEEIVSKGKQRDRVRARQAVAYFLRVHPDFQWPLHIIGYLLSRDHTTIFHSVQAIHELVFGSDNHAYIQPALTLVSALWAAHQHTPLPARCIYSYTVTVEAVG